MMRLLRKLSGGVAGEASISLLFFALYYLYLWLVVDLRLICHGGGAAVNFPVFYRGWEFFRGFLSYPGGPVDYVSAFLAQFFYIGWAGALVATVQAWLLWLCAGSVTRAASSRILRLVCFALPVLLLGYYARYTYPFDVAMTVLAALCFVCLYLGTASKSSAGGLLVFLVLSVILYAIAGAGYLLFVVVCGLYELLFRRRPALGVAFLLGGLTVAHVEGVAVFDFSVTRIFNYFMPRSYRDYRDIFVVVWVFYLLLPITLVGLGIGQLLRKGGGILRGRAAEATVSSQTTSKSGPGRLGRVLASSAGKVRGMLSPLLAIVVGVMVAYFYHNAELKAQIAASYYSCNGMWREVLEVAARYPQSKLINYATNHALYRTGRLAQDMFRYGQQPGALMLPGETENPVAWWRLFDTYLDLGHMNLAESMLTLAMDTYGERPVFLKRLALINMVKGNTGAAKVYLGTLSRTLFDAGWARGYLERIEADPNLPTDEQVQHLRRIMPEIDRDFKSLDESIFLDLLDKNRRNRMAFEYLAAHYLLTGQLGKFTGFLNRLDDFDYSGIPRVYEEAILYCNFTAKKNVKVPGREISPESRARFDGFCNTFLVRYGGNKQLALDDLAKNYGDSYLFYTLYGCSGMKK